ncbi:unnamed protein product [Penicillium egyptiacum]|uniref:Uncharacterized protein n=1 Tax=Penicillium egyptiacum TaxID=1303716 RepID=A0A9W4K732_9EURO|nr:unnamed protein product [Penicillium egyptiacum]
MDMSAHDESPKMPLRSPSLFESIESLPLDLILSEIESDILSEPLGSHEALHFLSQELSKESPQPLIVSAIKTVLSSLSLREKIEVQWSLCHDYNHAKSRQQRIEEGAPYNLASWSIENCSLCFKSLLDHQTVRPSSFCHGFSFFWLAVRSHQDDLILRLVSLMEPKDLLSPFANGDRRTIFQVSTWNRNWFQVCWARLKPLPKNGLTSLGPDEMKNIWQFADVDLANELLDLGLDLGRPHPENASPGWLDIVDRTDPGPLFNWLLSHGHQPPGKLLTYAAKHSCILGASWIMRYTDSHLDWSEAALMAAESVDIRSAEMLKNILPNLATKWKADQWKAGQALSENIVIKTVNGVCQEREDCGAMLSDDSVEKMFAPREDTAVRKIQTLGEVVGSVQVLGMKIKAEDAGLYHLATALENMGSRS